MIDELLSKSKKVFFDTYNRIPIEISHGEGVHLYDKNGVRYLDMFSGLGVNALGYSHPKIIEAVSNQISKYAHLSNNYLSEIQLEFAEKLLKYSNMEKVFLTNSGTETIEAAIKLIRLHHGPYKKIFSLTNSFHGRTYAAMTLTGKQKYKSGFEPLLPNIYQLQFNNIDELINSIDENTAAIFVEFIQGEGGINEVDKEFVESLLKLRSQYNFFIVSDCIQCGTGRTGQPYSHNYFNFIPDIIVTAKAIGGGLPLGAMMIKNQFNDIFSIGQHGTTFGGNPISCAAGKIVIEEVYENGLIEIVKENGNYFYEQLNIIKSKYSDSIKEVRGRGLMLGVELTFPGSSIIKKLREKNILSNCTNENVIRLLPPLIIQKNEIDFFLYSFEEILKVL
ncbi:MAG: acetylornithine/succinylornithine family transaminase [Ignavibacteriaceae bacterium]|nr:acetylornithine/succinylornithine family transaminase [Ignavibacteriaceae bacterium]